MMNMMKMMTLIKRKRDRERKNDKDKKKDSGKVGKVELLMWSGVLFFLVGESWRKESTTLEPQLRPLEVCTKITKERESKLRGSPPSQIKIP